jgi:hypothetical protein
MWIHHLISSEVTGIVRKITIVGLWCIQWRPADRPLHEQGPWDAGKQHYCGLVDAIESSILKIDLFLWLHILLLLFYALFISVIFRGTAYEPRIQETIHMPSCFIPISCVYHQVDAYQEKKRSSLRKTYMGPRNAIFILKDFLLLQLMVQQSFPDFVL